MRVTKNVIIGNSDLAAVCIRITTGSMKNEAGRAYGKADWLMLARGAEGVLDSKGPQGQHAAAASTSGISSSTDLGI